MQYIIIVKIKQHERNIIIILAENIRPDENMTCAMAKSER